MRRVAGLLPMTLALGWPAASRSALADRAASRRAGAGRLGGAGAPYSVERLVGAWGVASYRDEKDRARTEAQARAQCKNAYVIKRGPTTAC